MYEAENQEVILERLKRDAGDRVSSFEIPLNLINRK